MNNYPDSSNTPHSNVPEVADKPRMKQSSENLSSNPVLRIVQKHWTVVPPVKSDAQCEREKRLFVCLPFHPLILFPAAFIIQFCCGSLYAWSVFNAPIDKLLFGAATANRAVNTFYIAVGAFGVTAAFMGPWLERQVNGPRNGLLIGTSVFMLGNIVSAIGLFVKSESSIWAVYIGYGLLGGAGLGLNYICPVSCMQKWYVNHRGLASGLAVGGFGAGSIVWALVILPCINATSLPATFIILPGCMSITMAVCAMCFRTPPNDHVVHHSDDGAKQESHSDGETAVAHEENRQLSLIESITSIDYILMYIMFFGNQIFGLVALSRLATMCTDLFLMPDTTDAAAVASAATTAATVVSINGAFNCCGRLFFAFLSDWDAIPLPRVLRRKCVFVITLATQIAVISSLPTIIEQRDFNAFRAVMWILTFMYGAGFGSIPVFLTDMFGPYNIGALHGIILTAWSIGGVGGGLGFTSLYNTVKAASNVKDAYYANFRWLLAVNIVGFVFLMFVRTNPRDRFAPGYVLFGKTLFGGRKEF